MLYIVYNSIVQFDVVWYMKCLYLQLKCLEYSLWQSFPPRSLQDITVLNISPPKLKSRNKVRWLRCYSLEKHLKTCRLHLRVIEFIRNLICNFSSISSLKYSISPWFAEEIGALVLSLPLPLYPVLPKVYRKSCYTGISWFVLYDQYQPLYSKP